MIDRSRGDDDGLPDILLNIKDITDDDTYVAVGGRTRIELRIEDSTEEGRIVHESYLVGNAEASKEADEEFKLTLNLELQQLGAKGDYYRRHHSYMKESGKECLFDPDMSLKKIGELGMEAGMEFFSKWIITGDHESKCDNISRAYGLWMWDYQQEQICKGVKCKDTDIVRALANRFPKSGIVEDDKTSWRSNMKKYRGYLKTTNNSIQEISVLPVTRKSEGNVKRDTTKT